MLPDKALKVKRPPLAGPAGWLEIRASGAHLAAGGIASFTQTPVCGRSRGMGRKLGPVLTYRHLDPVLFRGSRPSGGRVEYVGVLYHVMDRGDREEQQAVRLIAPCDQKRGQFLLMLVLRARHSK